MLFSSVHAQEIPADISSDQYTQLRQKIDSLSRELHSQAKRYQDSLANIEDYLVQEPNFRHDIRQEKNTRNILIGLGIAAVFLAGGLYSRLRYTREQRTILEKKNQQIEQEKENALASEHAKQQFLANMSHEIRTPINAIKGMTDILLRRNPEPEQRLYLRSMKESSDTLLVVVNDILDITKIEEGKMRLEQIPFSLYRVISEVKSNMKPKAEAKGIEFITEVEEQIPHVVGDSSRLTQVLLNLVGNGIKFTDQGNVVLKLHTEKGEDNNSIIAHFCVKDTGIGIRPEPLKKIFDSFEQAHMEANRQFGGTGLGLSISKRLVEMHGGKIWAESVSLKGSQFYIDLPFMISESTGVPESEILPENVALHLKGINILLVEDNQFNAIVAREELGDAIEDLRLDLAVNGKIAVEMHQENEYDLILMDVNMPVMNGYEASQAIRAMEGEKSRIPIIAMTASIEKVETDKCFEAGMNDFIGKPFDTEDLLQKLLKNNRS